MAYFDQEQFELRCEWGIGGVTHLAPADVIIIVDILSFTTCVEIAVSRGATVFPYPYHDDSVTEYALERNAEIASPRSQRSGTYSLSPNSLMNVSSGLRLVLPSPNGSNLAFTAMSRGPIVLAGSLRNAAAVAAAAQGAGKRIAVVPAGERWPDGTLRPAIEDWVGAGAILKALPGTKSPEAKSAIAAFEECSRGLRESLLMCSSGRELTERGFGPDVDLASQLSVSTTVPILRGDAFISE
jgi:2-phosphosulfolactate phosphatase